MRDDGERLRQAIRAGNIGIFDHDHAAGTIFWSLELRRIYGWDPDEPATLPKIISHVHPDDLQRVTAAVQRSHDPDQDGAFDIEHRIYDRRGRLKWVLTRSQTYFGAGPGGRGPSRTIGAVQDVTERRTAEERLRVLDTVLSSSAQAIAIADGRGTLTFANAALHRLWGIGAGESLLGRSLFDLWKAPEPPEAALARIRDERSRQVETQARRADGSTFYLALTAEAVRDANGALAQVLVTFSDVTDRKRLESQLFQAQKMESIGRLAGGIAHDFNNVLTVMATGIDLTLRSLPPGAPSREILTDVAEATRSASALTRHLLAFSRQEMIAPRVLDLNQVVRRAEKTILRLVGEHIEVRTNCGDDVPPISFDPTQVDQIFINLALNARDAMPNGGRLTIETSAIRPAGAGGAAAGEPAGTQVLLAVSDTGQGMSEEVRAHIFEPFFTTKGPGEGTGLGLAMVYGAVQQNGGRTEVHSELGQGTTFRIYLPVARPEREAPPDAGQRGARAPAVAAPARRAAILLVEDDPRVRRLATGALSGLGYEVHAFGGGDEALAALPALRSPPELLMTDVVMPGMNGRVLADRVASLLPGIRVLFVSGYTDSWIVEGGVLKEGVEFLPKPYSVEQLAQRIRELLG